jgi:hypothetical protein
MRYVAKFLSQDLNIEEEVTIDVLGQILVCFANVVPYQIVMDNFYPVELHPKIFNDYILYAASVSEEGLGLVREGDGYAYKISGFLSGSRLSCTNGLVFYDENFMIDFPYLDRCWVVWVVDRLDVEFLDN